MNPQNGSLDNIYRRYRRQLFTCALAITRCPARAEDAIHDAFYRLFRLEETPRDLKAYVFRSVRNAAVDQTRKNPSVYESFPDFIFDPQPDLSCMAQNAEFQRRAAAALKELNADESETIVQRLFAGLTFREIADIRETPLGTVTSWYQRGIEKLRIKLESDHE